jgi:cytochrome oxidase Cu insertion factor (SCO1/SenC/PrrC family)
VSSKSPRLPRMLLWGLLVAVLVAVTAWALRTRLSAPDLPVLGQVPPFSLTDQRGETVTLDDLAGEPWIADFIFTRCTLSCPMMTTRMAELDDGRVPPEVRLVSFSVDPDHDTPEVLADYARAFGASQRWHFLTGPKKEILALAVEGFHLALEPEPPEGTAPPAEPIAHSTRFVLVDGQGRIRGYYDGMTREGVEQLERDTALLR